MVDLCDIEIMLLDQEAGQSLNITTIFNINIQNMHFKPFTAN